MLVLVFDIACSVFGLWPDPRKLSHCPRELILCLWALSCCSLLSITIVISIVGLRGKDWRHRSAAVVDCSVARSSICSFQQCRRDSRIPLRASYSMSVMIIINNNNVGGQYLWTRQLANILPIWEERSPRRQAMRGMELFCSAESFGAGATLQRCLVTPCQPLAARTHRMYPILNFFWTFL